MAEADVEDEDLVEPRLLHPWMFQSERYELELRELVSSGDTSAVRGMILRYGCMYPGAETVKLARTPQMVMALLQDIAKDELAGYLGEFERSSKLFIFKTVYGLLQGSPWIFRIHRPRSDLMVWLLQRGADKRIPRTEKEDRLKRESLARIQEMLKLVGSLTNDILVHILSFTEPFSPQQLFQLCVATPRRFKSGPGLGSGLGS